jgi:hypothetical protein
MLQKVANNDNSISKTMGESFKIFSQSLCTYDDEIASDGASSMLPLPDQNLMNMEAAY